MWLVHKHRILTKKNLQNRGWQGELQCQFCELDETSKSISIGAINLQLQIDVGS